MSSAPCVAAQLGQPGVEARRGRDHAHVAGGRLGDDAGDLLAVLAANASATAARSLYGSTIVSAAAAPVTPGESGRPNVATPGAGRGQQRVDVTVVAAGELDDLGPAGEAAGQPDRRHGRLGAGLTPAGPARPGDPGDDLLGQLDLALGRRAEDVPRDDRGPHRVDHRRVRVPEDQRTPGADQVDVVAAVGVDDVRPVPGAMNRGVPPTARNARTGEFTPPGVTASARSNSAADSGASYG